VRVCARAQPCPCHTQDLKQRDAVCAALRGLLKAQCGMADGAIDRNLDTKVRGTRALSHTHTHRHTETRTQARAHTHTYVYSRVHNTFH